MEKWNRDGNSLKKKEMERLQASASDIEIWKENHSHT